MAKETPSVPPQTPVELLSLDTLSPASSASPPRSASTAPKRHYHRRMSFTPAALKRLPRHAKIHLIKSINHIYHKDTGKKMTLCALLKDPSTTEIWSRSASNEFGRLMNGNRAGVLGTQAMTMVHPSTISQDQAITYASMVCDYRPLKIEAHRCRLVVGGDKLPYASDSAALAANLIESKILFNSVVSTKGAKFMTIDISNFSLSSHMQHPEYMKIHQDDIPQDILDQYKASQGAAGNSRKFP